MKILIEQASDWNFKEIRDSQTAEDILNLMSEFDEAIIIKKYNYKDNIDYLVTIYDDYVE